MREASGLVGEPVPLLKSGITTPVADFNVPLEQIGVDDWFCELVTYTGFLLCASRDILVRTVREGRALSFRRTRVFGYFSVKKFQFGFLLLSEVGGGTVGGEAMEEVLFVLLSDGSGQRLKSGEEMIGY